MSRSKQQSLFPEDDIPVASSVIEVLVREKPAGKSQSAFRRLVEKIALQRQILEEWKRYSVRYRQRISSELTPINRELQAGQRQMVLLIDELLSSPATVNRGKGAGLGKMHRRKLLHILMMLAERLLDDTPEDFEIERIHDKYADISHAETREINLAMEKSMLEQMLGMDLSECGESEDPLAFAQARLQQKAQARQEAREARRKRKAAEKGPGKQEQAAIEASASVREVYRKLASALHPDRETDPAERERKTAIMQRVNNAYDANDLLTLLNLQLEIEQIDAEHILSLSESRLKHYMQVLRVQLRELEDEIAAATASFSWVSHPHLSASPELVDRLLSQEIADARAMVEAMHRDLAAFGDPVLLRQMLKDYVITREEDGFDMPDVSEIFDFAPPKRNRRR